MEVSLFELKFLHILHRPIFLPIALVGTTGLFACCTWFVHLDVSILKATLRLYHETLGLSSTPYDTLALCQNLPAWFPSSICNLGDVVCRGCIC